MRWRWTPTQMGMGNLSRAEVERIITHADADGSGGIDYKEFVAMFSKSIAAERKAVLALQHQLPAQQHRPAADAAASPQPSQAPYRGASSTAPGGDARQPTELLVPRDASGRWTRTRASSRRRSCGGGCSRWASSCA